MRQLPWGFRLGCLIVVMMSLFAATSAWAANGSAGWTAYAEGLDALAEGRWPAAVASFTRALESAGDDATIVLARGAASTLAEDFPRALKDLERARRLGLRGREAELWTEVAEAMSGSVSPEHASGGDRPNRGRPGMVSIPGHIAQVRDDYSTEYGWFLAYQLANEYQKQRLPRDFGGLENPEATRSPQMRQTMQRAGRMFAEKWLKRPELASINLARAKESIRGGQGSSFVQAQRVLAAQPSDPEARYLVARSWLDAGRLAKARTVFTIALTTRAADVAAYLGRAMAAARLGDAKRARADLDTAGRLDSASTANARGAIEAELARQKVDGSAEKLLGDLERASSSGAPMDQLIGLAVRVHKVTGEARLRYDEIYQDRLRVLEDAVRANPKNPDRLADLAKYVIDEAENRGEKVEPRRAFVPYRWQESRERELGRAIAIADQALALNGNHVGAMMQKAWALTGLKQYDRAEQLADQALRLAGNNPDALRLYARFRSMRANQMSAEAAGLRQERCSSSTTRTDLGDRIRETTTTTCYPPSQADLQRAAQLEWQGARAALAYARRLDPTDARTPAYLGVVLQGDENPAEAAAAFRTALALEEARVRVDEQGAPPDKLIARDAMEFGLAMSARFRLAAPLEQSGKLDDAIAWYRGAAVYQRQMAPDWESQQMFSAMLPDQKPERGAVVPAPVNAATLVADAHLRLGKALAKAGKKDEALQHYAAAANLGPMRMAGIPQIGNSKGDTNFSGIAGAPAAEAQLYLAQALVAKGDIQGAQKALYEAERNLPDHLRVELNELNMAMARMHSSRPRDPYQGMSPEQQQYAAAQNQQDQQRMRQAMRQMAPQARVVPEVVGVWELTPGNKFLPWKKTLTVDASANYTLVSANDGVTTRGKMNIQMGRDMSRGGLEPARGQMMLFDETTGQVGTMWYEFTERDVMQITDLDGTKYEARRKSKLLRRVAHRRQEGGGDSPV